MARRWAFKEDYIVCQHVKKHNIFISSQELDHLVEILKERGWDRSRKSVRKRVYDYQNLLTGLTGYHAVDQVCRVSEWFIQDSQMDKTQQWIRGYVEEVYCENDILDEDDVQDIGIECLTNTRPGDKIQYIDIGEPVVCDRFSKVLDDLLKIYYKNHLTEDKTIWKVKQEFKDELEFTYGVPMNTFNAIHRDKYDTITKKVVFKLCFALNLNYDDADRLLSSAGYRFRRNVKFEVVIESILKCSSSRRFNINEIDQTLERHKCPTLFA